MSGLISVILLLSASSITSYKFPTRPNYRRTGQCDTIRVTIKSQTELLAVVKSPVEEDENLNEQFKEWEAEEEEIQRRELEDTVRQARAAGTEDELPDYMMRCRAFFL